MSTASVNIVVSAIRLIRPEDGGKREAAVSIEHGLLVPGFTSEVHGRRIEHVYDSDEMHGAWLLQNAVLSLTSAPHVRLASLVHHGGRWFSCCEDSSAVIMMMTGRSPIRSRGMAANSTLCRLEFFKLHRRALLISGGRLRRESGHRRHIDLDRALGVGVAFTNPQHALRLPRPKLNNSY